MIRLACLAVLTIFTLSPGFAAPAQHQHSQPMAPGAVAGMPSVKAFIAANARMHKDMEIEYTGHADMDFLKGMIPHHQGAVEMARSVLKYGHDPKVKDLAQQVIATQEKEIASMKAQLAALEKQRGTVQ